MNISQIEGQAISAIINKLRLLTQIDVQDRWHSFDRDLTISIDETGKQFCQEIELDRWEIASTNDKGYITFPAGRQVRWLAQKLIIPQDLQAYLLQGSILRLALTWWAEDAQIFVNGELFQQGDLFDSSARVLLTRSTIPGEEIIVAIRLISPGHDIGALMRSKCIYEVTNFLDPGFVADELSVLHKYLETFEPDRLDLLKTEIDHLDWSVVFDPEKFDQSLGTLRQNLLPLAEKIKERCFHLLGHAHLDMAWLWTTRETYSVAQRTFASVLNLQQDFPDLTFCHTSPALYAWIEQNRPDLFAAIQTAVKQGKWEVLGGMWIEPDVNLVSGESLVRQLLYGQRYVAAKFGTFTKIVWLPDSFGFAWQLPQICQQSGIEYFVTGKLHWNDTTKFPYGCFWWQSPDGTKLFTLMSPPNVTGVMDTNPIAMTDYALSWESQTGLKDIFWLPGVGDHGGGPTRDMLEVQEKWYHSPFFPKTKFTTAIEYLDQISSDDRVPVWDDELYLELHRGCYTTHADRKRSNRYCENLLYQAELFSLVSNLVYRHNQEGDNKTVYFPNINKITAKTKNCQLICRRASQQEEIDRAWQKVLFNQFHDILPGTSITEVFTEAKELDTEAIEIGERILQASLKSIASQITLPPPPQPNAQAIFVFNPLNWERTEVVGLNFIGEIYDCDGQKIPSQITSDDRVLFVAEKIPSIGYRVFWLCSIDPQFPSDISDGEFILENDYIKAIVNPETGDLDSIFDKHHCREILKGAGNQLQSYADRGQYWDAWNIDPDYEQHPLPPTQLKSIQWLDRGSIQFRLEVVRQLGQSEFRQIYILDCNSPILKISTTVDWQETHVMVKVAFPFNLDSDRATYEIACGAIERTTDRQTPQEKAKWEVPALRWADLTDNSGEYGVSILNDCKYGYDSQRDRLRLTLLRSPKWPDPEADRGYHQFTYAIYPHRGNWKTAKTVHHGYELNLPLQIVVNESIENRSSQCLPTVGKFLDLEADNLILMALKTSDQDGKLIMRCYECCGQNAQLKLTGDLNFKIDRQVNCLEEEISSESIELSSIEPWKITSWQISFKN